MGVYVTGDTHGYMDISKIAYGSLKHSGIDKDDINYLIVAGDFGLIFNNVTTPTEQWWIDWLSEKPWITLVVIGNHENYERIYSLPKVNMFGSECYKLNDKIYYLIHGNCYKVEDQKFMVFGGAESIDKANRVNRVSWWQEEIPTSSDIMRFFNNYKENEDINFIVTHTCPEHVVMHVTRFEEKLFDPTCKMLTAISNVLTPGTRWFFGHFHTDTKLTLDHEYIAIFQKVIKVNYGKEK